MLENIENTSDFLFYSGHDGSLRVEVIVGDETVWLNQKSMAELFDVDRSVITKHLSNIYSEGELDDNSTCAKIAQVQIEGNREVKREVEFYNLDAIIAVGYRVNSYNATQFRIWATKILKEYLIKGFALDDERLKQGKSLFGKNYFEELLERIREIRASERVFYQKITDIYKDCSIDYDANSPITHTFYATVQNKLHWAIHGHTAAELIKLRANAGVKNMGLSIWKNAKSGGKILKSDVVVAKNYLQPDEMDSLNRLVVMYLEFADNMARRKKAMKMSDWVQKLDDFLNFNEYQILKNAGKYSHDVAKSIAENEYAKYRVIQDKEYKSDFDKIVGEIKIKGTIPKEKPSDAPKKDPLSDMNKKLKKALEFNPNKGENKKIKVKKKAE